MTKPSDRALLAAIDDLVEKRTFTADALKGIEDLRRKAQVLNELVDLQDTKIKEAQDAKNIAQRSLEDALAKLNTWNLREKSLLEREAKITELEKLSAVAKAESTIYSSVFQTIFKNTQIRENVTRNVSHPSPHGGYSTTPESEYRISDKD